MKKLLLILAVIAAALLLWFGWHWLDARRKPSVDKPSIVEWKVDPPTKIDNDPVKIFQRAFWASPTSEDKILHAERREWSGPDGVEKWQWFLVVEPSPALLKRLRDDNAFGLIPAPSAIDIVNAPNWFQFKREEVSVLKSPQAKLQLIFSKDNHTLYATDSGLGFRRGAPEQIPKTQPSSSAPSSGRLPITPPPRPKAPTEE
jgi:hypothetical protein